MVIFVDLLVARFCLFMEHIWCDIDLSLSQFFINLVRDGLLENPASLFFWTHIWKWKYKEVAWPTLRVHLRVLLCTLLVFGWFSIYSEVIPSCFLFFAFSLPFSSLTAILAAAIHLVSQKGQPNLTARHLQPSTAQLMLCLNMPYIQNPTASDLA